MTSTTATAIETNLGEDNYGIFESGVQQLLRLSDRDIYKIELDELVAPAPSDSLDAPAVPIGDNDTGSGTIIVVTDAISASTAAGFPLDIDATNRIFGDNSTLTSPELLAAEAGDPIISILPVNDTDADTIFIGINMSSGPAYDPTVAPSNSGATILFNYETSIAYLSTDLDANADGVLEDSELDLLFVGTSAADTLTGSDSNADEVLVGFGGDDLIEGGDGNDEVEGGSGNDVVSGQDGDDYVRGGDGNDRAFGGDGNDILEGGTGNDTVRSGIGDDVVEGGDGDDLLSGEQGNDTLLGGDGNDTINGGPSTNANDNDTLNGDDIFLESDNDDVSGGGGDDDLRGNDGSDTLNGDDGDDILRGNSDNDILLGGDGDDTVFGGLGDDTLMGDADDDSLRGGSGNDALDGGSGNDLLSGEFGNDILLGGNGDDTLTGGGGTDTLRGYGDGSSTVEKDILIGTVGDSAGDNFVLAGDTNTFYDQGGDDDFAWLRNVTVAPNHTMSASAEDRIILDSTSSYRLSDVSLEVLNLGAVSGVGIYLDDNNGFQDSELIAVIENVFEADIAGGIGNDLFQFV